MENVVPTIYGAHLQTSQFHNLPYQVLPYTTLNEKLGIQSGIAQPTGAYPSVKYYAIGNSGHSFSAGADGVAYPKLYQHASSDAALFGQVPFVLRAQGNDISPSMRANYALRKEISVNGSAYIAYYLRRIDLTSVTTSLLTISDDTGSTNFVPTADNLSPTPTILSTVDVNTITGTYLKCTAPLAIGMDQTEVSEFLNAIDILYGSDNYAIISDIALCSGFDKTITITAAAGSFNFNEAICVQPVAFVSDFRMMKYNTLGFSKVLDSAASTPLFIPTP